MAASRISICWQKRSKQGASDRPPVTQFRSQRMTRSMYDAWRRLTPEVIKSVDRCPYLERAGQTYPYK